MFAGLVAAAVLAGSAPADSAPAEPSPAFRLQDGADWSEVLAICDLTRFLLEQRALDADVILARDDQSGWFRPLLGPRFLPPNLLYDGDVRRAFNRLERAGKVTHASVAEARAMRDRPMLRAFRRMRGSERLFLETQSRTCSARLAETREPRARP